MSRRSWVLRRPAGRFGGGDIALLLCALGVLVFCLYYAYLYWKSPRVNFVFSGDEWTVINPDENCRGDCIQPGDEVLRLGTVTREEVAADRFKYLFKDFRENPGIAQPVSYLRDGEIRILYLKASPTRASDLGIWFFPLTFWFAGALAILFLRPRNMAWKLLVAIFFDIALWGSAGFLSTSQDSGSSVLFRLFVWPFAALLVHLHVIFPSRRFPFLERTLVAPFWVFCLVMVVVDHVLLLEQAWVVSVLCLAMAISTSLLALRLIRDDDPIDRLLGFGFGIGFLPIILQALLYATQQQESLGLGLYQTFNGIMFLAILPFWPFSYLYALYRRGQGAVEFRANRLVSVYGFYALYTTLFVAAFMIVTGWARDGSERLAFSLFLSLGFAFFTVPFRDRVYRFVDQKLYGIYYEPHQVISRFAELIPSSFNRSTLEQVICKEILPILMVRQSALYAMEDDKVKAIYEQGKVGPLPTLDELRRFRVRIRPFRSLSLTADERFPWVRLCIPLATQDRVIGLWLLGDRDPDDFYPRSDIRLLSRLANQIAPVIENVRLVEMARQEVEENRRLQEQLVQSQKMEAIGRLSAGVAHDFNNLLSVILGYSSLLIARYRSDESLHKYLTDIRDAGDRAAALTKQLLAFSRQQVMEASIMDLNSVVVDVEKMLRRLTGEDIEVRADLEPGLPSVRIDRSQMGQVIMNLAVNARDAMPEGGSILIRTYLHELEMADEDPQQGGIPAGSYVAMALEDSGTGIEPELLHRIFEPYFTTKELGKGTGLGLSMVYGIINQSKGYIRVSSTVGKGTTFRIYLPAVRAAPDAGPHDAVGEPSSDVGNEVILVVEDEDSVRQVACEILNAKGYEVLEAARAAEALDLFRDPKRTIDLLLTDVMMPQMKGPELAREALALRPELRIVFMSGYNEESILGKRLGEEGTLLIQKPFTPNDLARQIRQVLDLPRESPIFNELGAPS